MYATPLQSNHWSDFLYIYDIVSCALLEWQLAMVDRKFCALGKRLSECLFGAFGIAFPAMYITCTFKSSINEVMSVSTTGHLCTTPKTLHHLFFLERAL